MWKIVKIRSTWCIFQVLLIITLPPLSLLPPHLPDPSSPSPSWQPKHNTQQRVLDTHSSKKKNVILEHIWLKTYHFTSCFEVWELFTKSLKNDSDNFKFTYYKTNCLHFESITAKSDWTTLHLTYKSLCQKISPVLCGECHTLDLFTCTSWK